MAGKLSPGAQVRLATLQDFEIRVNRVYALVEQYAAAKVNADALLQPVTRAFGQLKLQLMGAGLDSMSQLCGSMELAARRGLSPSVKVRILREGAGSLKFQLELAMRAVVSDDAAEQRKRDAAAAQKDATSHTP